MQQRPLRLLVLVTAASLLMACKAEKVEIRLDGDAVLSAANGTLGEVRFEALIAEQYTTVDDEKRALIASLSEVLMAHFPDADVDVSIGADEYEIEVDGSLAVSNSAPTTGAPWYVSATKAADGDGVLVQLLPSKTYGAFDAAVEELNSMLGPDEFQPVEYRFTAASGTVIAGGALVDGTPTGIIRIPMIGQQLKMLFKDGIWDNTSGAFIFVP